MFLDQPIAWTSAHGPAVLIAGVLVALLTGLAAYIAHRTSGNVLAASIGALVCTGFSADTSWRFADHRLHMETSERLWLFAAGEIVLVVCAVMARANKIATADGVQAGTPGVPGVMVWAIAGVQIIPAFTESGLTGGLVRAFFGPVMAALLWHLAMGLEIRVARPQALSTGLPAQIGHELRERLLSYLGLATRGRSAAQVSRDRATTRAVRLASRRRLGWWGRAALKSSVARSGAALDAGQRHQLLQLLAARRSAGVLRDIDLPTPWTAVPVPAPYPATPLGVTGAELRRLDPLDAVLRVHAAHPDHTPAELAAIATEYGVPVSETQVRIAIRARTPGAVPAVPVPDGPELPGVSAVPEPTDPVRLPAAAVADEPLGVLVPATTGGEYTIAGLHLDLVTETEVRREFASAVPASMVRTRRTRPEVHARVPDELEDAGAFVRWLAAEECEQPEAVPGEPRTRTRPEPVPAVPDVPASSVPVPGATGTGGADDVPALLAWARAVDAAHRQKHRRPASIQTLKKQLGVGQAKAQTIRAALDTQAGMGR